MKTVDSNEEYTKIGSKKRCHLKSVLEKKKQMYK